MPIILVLRMLRQEDFEFEPSLDNTRRPVSETKQNRKQNKNMFQPSVAIR
jgi:hypothetical protein